MKVVPVEKLTAVEYRACLRANFGKEDGYMYETLKEWRNKTGALAILDWDGPVDKTASLKAWCLLTPVTKNVNSFIAVSDYVYRHSKYTLMFYVKKKYRKKGIATQLMLEAKKYDPEPNVIPHDTASGELFSKFKVHTLRHERYHMKKKPRVA